MDLQEDMVIEGIYTYTPQNITWDRVSVFDTYLHCPCIRASVKKNYYAQQ
jgi:hypothetical protein